MLELYLWPDNLFSWNLFQKELRSQWVVSMDGPTGLNYAGVESYLRMKDFKRKRRAELIDDICAIERAMLDAWDERRNKESKSG